MAKGAYFAGATQASQVKPVDFGDIALGFSKVINDKRAAEAKQKETDEMFSVELTKFAEPIYDPFDNTGISNVDIMGQKLRDGIVAHADVVNKMFSEGRISKSQAMARMTKLKAQATKYSEFMTGLSTFAGNVNKLGNKASESTLAMLSKMDQLGENAVPVVDSQGNISFLSQDGEKVSKTPFSQLNQIMDVRERVDEFNIIDTLVKTEGEQNKFFEGDSIRKSYLTPDGTLTENQSGYINNIVKSLDIKDVYDIGKRAGFEIEPDDTQLFGVKNEEQLRSQVTGYLQNLATDAYKRKDSEDRVAFLETTKRLELTEKQLEKAKKDGKEFVKTTGSEVLGYGKMDQYSFVKPFSVYNITGTDAQGKVVEVTKGVVSVYYTNAEGEHVVKLSVPKEKVYDEATMSYVGGGYESVEIDVADEALINSLEAQLGIEKTVNTGDQDTSRFNPQG